MKKIFSNIKTQALNALFFSIFSIIFISWIVYAAISWPSTPTWEVAWWKFMNYFNKLVVDDDITATWTVKNSDRVDWLHAADISWWLWATTWWYDKFVAYWVTSCPSWWTKAYDWILVNLWWQAIVDWTSWPANSQPWSIVCAGNWRTDRDDVMNGTMHQSHWFLAVGNYWVWDKNMACAVCVR